MFSLLSPSPRLRVRLRAQYELSTEFDEALEHCMEEGRNTKVMLKVNDIGITY